jgi:hypothetical protein
MADRPANRPSRPAVPPDQSIVHDPEARLWLLRTPSSGYVLGLDSTDVPRGVHWGVSLTLELARSIAVPELRPGSGDSGPDPGAQEYAVEGGMRSGAPSLQLRYADGGRGVCLRYLGQRIAGTHLTVDLADRVHPVRISLHYRVRPGSDVIKRWTTLRGTLARRADHRPATGFCGVVVAGARRLPGQPGERRLGRRVHAAAH